MQSLRESRLPAVLVARQPKPSSGDVLRPGQPSSRVAAPFLHWVEEIVLLAVDELIQSVSLPGEGLRERLLLLEVAWENLAVYLMAVELVIDRTHKGLIVPLPHVILLPGVPITQLSFTQSPICEDLWSWQGHNLTGEVPLPHGLVFTVSLFDHGRCLDL